MLDLYTMGERIRQAREDMGYTRETFSEMANITPRFCYDIESGKKGVSIDTLKNICEALNLSADHLLDLKPLDTDAYDYTIFHVLMEQCPNSYRDGLYRVMSAYVQSVSEALKKEFGQATFFTATDGNHGRGVAWAANRLGQKAVVHMPKGTTQTRLQNIAKEGAQVDIQELNYDDCVRLAAKEADETPRGVIVQDTAWDGYEEIPAWIMQGYGTMAMEAGEQLKAQGCERPTHIFVQAGVGSLAGAVVGYFSNLYADNLPTFVVVEAEAAACLYKGAAAGDGDIRIVDGDMQTIMAGLACGEPNTISWDILKNHVKVFIAAPDWVAANGMRMLAAPVKGDAPITSGESGAAPFGALAAMMTMDEYKDLRNDIGLDENSKVLLFSTEGDTDPDRYKNIVWKGLDK